MSEKQPPSEKAPRDAGAILAEVGLTPEQLQGKKVVSFGESLAGKVEGAEITDFTTDHYEYYLATNVLAVEGDLNYVVVVGESILQKELDYPGRSEFLGEVMQLLKPDGGILLIAKPVIKPQYADSPEDVEVDYERAMEDRGLKISARYDESDRENPYMSIQNI